MQAIFVLRWFAKLTALLEYHNLSQNFQARSFCMIFAYEIYFTNEANYGIAQEKHSAFNISN